MTSILSQCYLCQHYTGGRKCKAFADLIPLDISLNKVLHTKPYPGDNGIQFEPISEGLNEQNDDNSELRP